MSEMLATPERWESLVRRMKDAGVFDGDPPVSYEELRQFHDEGNYEIGLSNDFQIELELDSHEPVLRTMIDRKWRLCISGPESGGFVTSDHPVCLMRGDRERKNTLYPIGYGTHDSIVVFPLSPELLVVGAFDGASDVVQLSPTQVAYMNGIICYPAYRQIYSPNCEFRVLVGKNPTPMTAPELSDFLKERAD
jgi:Protein of unknown function (DUF4238)